jgi:hypothetical protein
MIAARFDARRWRRAASATAMTLGFWLAAGAAAAPAGSVLAEETAVPVEPAPPATVAAPLPPAEPTEEQVMVGLIADLQRYSVLTGDEVRREIATVTQALARQRNDANRVRLATLYALSRNAPDDQRAVQLFDTVIKGAAGSSSIKQLAGVVQVQVAERLRAVREEQLKADAAVQKLEALRAMERSLLRDRVRSGGGGGGGGSGN